jgi:N-acetylglucosaminyldiphosphoundecaprenol N-acetyl-beta-D-mannosaminyltransferase
MLPSFDVLGIPISITTPIKTAEIIEAWAQDQTGRFVCVREVPSLMVSIENEDLIALHHKAALVIPDGMPLVWIGKSRGLPVERTCGPDLMDLMIKRSPVSGLKHYFYGGKEGVAKRLVESFQTKYPGCQIVGWECPPFRDLTELEEREMRERIGLSGADVVWVGISSPKQDIWMERHYEALPQTLIGVGAAFDFHTGAIRRAPVWMQKSGLEWFHRLMSEPKRLWSRYLVLVPKFVWLVMRRGG